MACIKRSAGEGQVLTTIEDTQSIRIFVHHPSIMCHPFTHLDSIVNYAFV